MTYEKFKALSTALEEEDCWSTCIELRKANGKLWERQWGALEGQKQDTEVTAERKEWYENHRR